MIETLDIVLAIAGFVGLPGAIVAYIVLSGWRSRRWPRSRPGLAANGATTGQGDAQPRGLEPTRVFSRQRRTERAQHVDHRVAQRRVAHGLVVGEG
jgi:hypothetical protein